jgi:hypothetical protein
MRVSTFAPMTRQPSRDAVTGAEVLRSDPHLGCLDFG